MPLLYELEVESIDTLKVIRTWKFVVIADNKIEMEEEIDEVMAHHEEVSKWRVSRLIKEVTLSDTSQYSKDYKDKGCHSYYE